MWISTRIAAAAQPAAMIACFMLVAGCAENKPPAPEAQMTSGVEPGTTQDFLLNVGDRVFFNENSAELSPTATASLDKQAAWLARFTAYSITVEGHSDEKGSKQKNKKLSEQRAQAVQKYLVEHGIDPARIHVASYGRERRVATCNDISCWSQNRRVVTLLQTAADPLIAQERQPAPRRLPAYAPPPRG